MHRALGASAFLAVALAMALQFMLRTTTRRSALPGLIEETAAGDAARLIDPLPRWAC
jgi:hypothetical protein